MEKHYKEFLSDILRIVNGENSQNKKQIEAVIIKKDLLEYIENTLLIAFFKNDYCSYIHGIKVFEMTTEQEDYFTSKYAFILGGVK